MQQSACLDVNPIKVDSYGFFFNCATVGQTSDLMTAPTFDPLVDVRCLSLAGSNVVQLESFFSSDYVVVVFPDHTHLLFKQAQQSTSSNGRSKFSNTVQILYTEFDVVVSTVNPLNHSPSI